MPKLLILAGAPSASSLNWSLPLHDTFTRPISSLLDPDPSSTSPAPSPSAPSSSVPAWRSVPLVKAPLKTGFTQTTQSSDAPLPSFLNPQFLPSPSQPFSEDPDDYPDEPTLSQFYDVSITAHDTYLSDTSFSDHSYSEYSFAPSLEPGIAAPPTDLSELRASTLDPRPLTLLVGVISLSEKTVATRFGERDVVEALVGDDTRSAFQLTFWLGAPGATSPLSASVSGLRIGDVVLVQGVAAGVFRGRVYGQSVRGGMGTRAYLLFRESGDGEAGHYSWGDMVGRGEVHPQLGKTRRVRRWMRGMDMGGHGDGEEERMADDTLEFE